MKIGTRHSNIRPCSSSLLLLEIKSEPLSLQGPTHPSPLPHFSLHFSLNSEFQFDLPTVFQIHHVILTSEQDVLLSHLKHTYPSTSDSSSCIIPTYYSSFHLKFTPYPHGVFILLLLLSPIAPYLKPHPSVLLLSGIPIKLQASR